MTPRAFVLDQRRFETNWVPVCRAEDLPGVGAQKAVQAGGTPVLIVRDDTGALHALANVCRHRNLILVDDQAFGPLIRCPYHLWAYDLVGRLAAAPFMEEADLTGCDLPRYRLAQWGGWVFVNIEGRAAPLEAVMAPLEESLGERRLESWRAGFRLAFEHDWNWKVMVENFAESYHHIGVHAETLQHLWPGGESDSGFGGSSRIELRHSRDPQAGTFVVHVVLPHFLLAVFEPEDAAYWYRMVPLGPERIALEIVGLFPPDVAGDAAAMAAAKDQTLAVHFEDIPMCARVQAGLRAPDAVLGPLSPLEDGIRRFRAWAAQDP